MEQIGLNGFIKSIFEGYKAAKEANYDPFAELQHSWRLLEVDEVSDLCKKAKTKEQHEMILDHMYKWDATRVGYYKRIEKNIINQYWGE